MFNLFKKKELEQQPNLTGIKIEGKFASGQEHGTLEERDELFELEGKLEVALQAIGADHDGHEMGEGNILLFSYGPDPEKMWEVMESLIRQSSYTNLVVDKQFDPGNGQKIAVKQIRL